MGRLRIDANGPDVAKTGGRTILSPNLLRSRKLWDHQDGYCGAGWRARSPGAAADIGLFSV
jgi:hypothetical protein